MQIWLSYNGRTWPVEMDESGTLSLGRGLDNDVQLEDKQVSQNHGKLFIDPDGEVKFYDLESRNGSFLNGVRIERGFLFPGDVARLGDTLLFLTASESQPPRVLSKNKPRKELSMSPVGPQRERRTSNSFHVVESRKFKGFNDDLEGHRGVIQDKELVQQIVHFNHAVTGELDLDCLLPLLLETFIHETRSVRGLILLATERRGFDPAFDIQLPFDQLASVDKDGLRTMVRKVAADGDLLIQNQSKAGSRLGQSAYLFIPLCASAVYHWSHEDERRAQGKDDKIFAYVYLDKRGRDYPEGLSPLLRIMAAQAGMALQNAGAYRQVTTDPLTGTLNRDSFCRFLSREMEQCQSQKRPLSLLMFGLDQFESLLEDYGSQLVEEIVKTVATFLKNYTRKSDLIGRYGEREFVLCLPDTDAKGGMKLAEKLRTLLGDLVVAEQSLSLTCSIGLSAFPSQSRNVDQLIHFAHKALCHSWLKGGNQARAWRAGMRSRGLEREALLGFFHGDVLRDHKYMNALLHMVTQLTLPEKSPLLVLAGILKCIVPLCQAKRILLFVGGNWASALPIVVCESSPDQQYGEDFFVPEILETVYSEKRVVLPGGVGGRQEQARVLCFPLLFQSELFGALYFEYDEGRPQFSLADVSFLKIVARQFAIFLKSQRKDEAQQQIKQYRERIQELELSLELQKKSSQASKSRRGDTEVRIDLSGHSKKSKPRWKS
ncbi:MAG: diguanylate cyclase [Planctomycetota bacterium]|nr:diguanylate cyclase [Planctomycetota bacterium]